MTAEEVIIKSQQIQRKAVEICYRNAIRSQMIRQQVTDIERRMSELQDKIAAERARYYSTE